MVFPRTWSSSAASVALPKGGMMLLKSPNPIADQKDDTLGRWPFAKAVAQLIRAQPTDRLVVLGVEGALGAGKSSVLEMAAGELQRDARNRVIRISAWRGGSQDQFLANLGFAMAAALKRDWQSSSWRIAWARLNRQSLPVLMAVWMPILTIAAIVLMPSLRAWLKPKANADYTKLATGLGIFGIPLITLFYSKVSAPVVASFLGLFGEQKEGGVGAMERFSSEFDVLGAAQSRGSRFIVLVEDLDRCAAPRVTDILSSIAQLQSHPRSGRLAFLLAYDRSILLSSIEKDAVAHLKDDDDKTALTAAAADYLGRVVPLELPLPPENRTAAVTISSKWRPRRIPVLARALVMSIALVGVGTALVTAGGTRIAGICLAVVVGVLLIAEAIELRVLAAGIDQDDVPGWEEAEKAADPWLPVLERDRTRVLNKARIALALADPSDAMTAWEAISLQALDDRWPDAFDVERLAEAKTAGSFGSEVRYLNVEVPKAIEAMKTAGFSISHFDSPSKQWNVLSAVKR